MKTILLNQPLPYTLEKISILCCVILLFSSCVKDPQQPVIEYFNIETYAALDVGDVWMYKVDSIIYSYSGGDTNDVLASSSYVKYKVEDTFRTEGILQYEISVSVSKDSLAPYTFLHREKALFNDEGYIYQEGNIPFLKMPKYLEDNSEWDAFSLFDEDEMKYFIGGNNIRPFQNSTLAYIQSSTDTVFRGEMHKKIEISLMDNQNFENPKNVNLVDARIYKETYVQGIGLVRQYQLIASTNCAQFSVDLELCYSKPWHERATSGLSIHKTLIDWK